MSFFGTLALLAVGAEAVKIGVDKANDYVRDYFREKKDERERIQREEHNKLLFSRISQEEFAAIAEKAAVGLPRVIRTNVYDASVLVTVESKSGLTEWDFILNFDYGGYLTGDYTVWTENDDSVIPDALGRRIRNEIVYKFCKDKRTSETL